MDIKKVLQARLADNFDKRELEQIIKIIVADCFQNKAIQPETVKNTLDTIIEKLLQDVPIQYITGVAFFYGFRFIVNHNVLIPRPETEELVDWVIQDHNHTKGRILDVGTGSGCIAITLSKKLDRSEVFALDASLDALDVAKMNAKTIQADVRFLNLDFLDRKCLKSLPNFDLIVSNPPYISDKDKNVMDESVKMYEPKMALYPPGTDHLIFYKKLEAFFQTQSEKCQLYMEINEFYVDEIESIYFQYSTELRKDLSGNNRMLKVSR